MALSLTSGSRHARKTLEESAAHTSSDNTARFSVDSYTAADIHLSITAVAGTSPTLNVYVQKWLPDLSTWQDVISFTQATAASAQIASFVSAGNSVAAVQTEALAAGSIKTTLMGAYWRVRWVIAGTSPSFTFSVSADFFI